MAPKSRDAPVRDGQHLLRQEAVGDYVRVLAPISGQLPGRDAFLRVNIEHVVPLLAAVHLAADRHVVAAAARTAHHLADLLPLIPAITHAALQSVTALHQNFAMTTDLKSGLREVVPQSLILSCKAAAAYPNTMAGNLAYHAFPQCQVRRSKRRAHRATLQLYAMPPPFSRMTLMAPSLDPGCSNTEASSSVSPSGRPPLSALAAAAAFREAMKASKACGTSKWFQTP